jgi:hypothetical protein
MIGVAGAVAEDVWSDDAVFLENEGAWAWQEEAIMSPTDWRLTGCAPGEPDKTFMRAVGKVIDLLNGTLRAELYATARQLIVGLNA